MKKLIIDQLTHKFRGGVINRRDFITSALAAGATLPMALSFF